MVHNKMVLFVFKFYTVLLFSDPSQLELNCTKLLNPRCYFEESEEESEEESGKITLELKCPYGQV